MSAPRIVQVFRSARREGMYLIVDRARGLADVPEALLGEFGRAEASLVFQLHAQRRMAHAEAPAVLEAIERQGFYLQMPPAEEASDDV